MAISHFRIFIEFVAPFHDTQRCFGSPANNSWRSRTRRRTYDCCMALERMFLGAMSLTIRLHGSICSTQMRTALNLRPIITLTSQMRLAGAKRKTAVGHSCHPLVELSFTIERRGVNMSSSSSTALPHYFHGAISIQYCTVTT